MTDELFIHYHRWFMLQVGEDEWHALHLSEPCTSSHGEHEAKWLQEACGCNECLDLFEEWMRR